MPAYVIGGATLLGGSLGARSSADSTKRSIRFQREIAKNKYQYLMDDLQSAGLNPILAAQTATAGPAGASAPVIPYMNPIGEGISTGMDYRKQDQEIKKMQAEVKKVLADYNKVFVEMGVMEEQKKKLIAEQALIKVRKDFEELGLPRQKWEAYKYDNLLKGIKTIINYDVSGEAKVTEDRKFQFDSNIPHGTYITP